MSPATVAQGLLEQLEQAWNTADGAAYGAAFAEDSDFVDIRGGHHRGRASIAEGHQGIFDSIYAGSTLRIELEVARALDSGALMAVATSTLDAPHGPLQGVNHARATMIIEQGRIAAFQNTLIA